MFRIHMLSETQLLTKVLATLSITHYLLVLVQWTLYCPKNVESQIHQCRLYNSFSVLE